jgi:hypothetical protein
MSDRQPQHHAVELSERVNISDRVDISPEQVQAMQAELWNRSQQPDRGFALEIVGAAPMKVFQILEQDLRSAAEFGDREALNLAFFTLCLGAVISAAIGWISAQNSMSPWQFAAYFTSTAALAVATIFFGVQWRGTRSARKAQLSAIYARTGIRTSILPSEPR